MSHTAGREIVGIIPARWDSTRFPGKPLASILGRPLLHWVIERVQKSKTISRIIVATDDERVRACALDAGAECFMTRAEHATGTDRVAEVAERVDADAVINIQGDEPTIDPALIDRLGEVLVEECSDWDMVTAATPIEDESEIEDPNVVKVVFGARRRAMYFSRAAIPHNRDDVAGAQYWQHLGIYGYTVDFLKRFVAEPPCEIENIEKLEQLRALHIGCRMKVVPANRSSVGVDVPADVAKVEALLGCAGEGAVGEDRI